MFPDSSTSAFGAPLRLIERVLVTRSYLTPKGWRTFSYVVSKGVPKR
mgnify:CR=1 FL=1